MSVVRSTRGQFQDYTQAIRNLARDARFPIELIRKLERFPGFRNVVIHEYVPLDMERVVEALDDLEPVELFLQTMRQILSEGTGYDPPEV